MNTSKPVQVALYGATGRMGYSLIRAMHDSTDYRLTLAVAYDVRVRWFYVLLGVGAIAVGGLLLVLGGRKR